MAWRNIQRLPKMEHGVHLDRASLAGSKQPGGDLTHDDFSELLSNIWRAQGEEADASTFADVHSDLATSWPSLLHSMAVAMEAAMPDQ